MKNKWLFYAVLSFFLLPWSRGGHGQTVAADSVFYRQVTETVLADVAVSRSRIYTGSAYQGLAYDNSKGHPYLESPYLQEATIVYEGLQYARIPLLYDLAKNELVIGDATRPDVLMVLDKEKVSKFRLKDREFFYVPANPAMAAGHYERLASGKVQVWAQREKVAKGKDQVLQVIKEFKDKNQYFLSKEGKYYSVKNKEDVFNALAAKKKELQLFTKQEKLNFAKDPEAWLVQVSKFYNRLVPQDE